eukprot:TRINITY_DN1897_c0_g3_i1.p1 TRINITY_DN1897_c0_g3~~TRINITY_DN1897_c0_g3_i1.p1  ORF type:complete len:313 (+),score=108.12 TRINITY_DN1897_c0_g3_i1:92-1030(+)
MEDLGDIYSRSTFQTEPEMSLPKVNIENFKIIFTPDDIVSLTSLSDMRYGMTEFMSRYFAERDLQDKIDINELNIIADFHYYNLSFAKDQLLLPNNKTALLLNVMARLIEFRDLTASAAIKTVSQEMQRSEEEEYKLLLEQKFDGLRDALLACSVDNPPFSIRIFTTDDVKKILDYTMSTYFLNFRLYHSVMSNKQFSEQKSIEVYIDEPMPIPPLSEGLIDNPEREEIESENTSEVGEEEDKEEKKEEAAAEPKTETKKPESTHTTAKRNKLVESLIDMKVQQLKEELGERIGEHDKTFGKTIDDLKAPKK